MGDQPICGRDHASNWRPVVTGVGPRLSILFACSRAHRSIDAVVSRRSSEPRIMLVFWRKAKRQAQKPH